MIITLDDADRCRQWFDAICDVNPEFLDSEDYRLGLSLYDACGMRPSDKLQKDADAAYQKELRDAVRDGPGSS
jgi:hypothetical protein